MTITVEDFLIWLKENNNIDLTYTQKAVIKNVVEDYATQYGHEAMAEQISNQKYEEWLGKEFEWAGQGVHDVSQGISTYVYNKLRRHSEFDNVNKKWVSILQTNRDLVNATDRFLRQKAKLSENAVKEVREYLAYNKQKYYGEG